MSYTNLELNLEELVLHDFPGVDRDRIARAVQRELERLFAERGIPLRCRWWARRPRSKAEASKQSLAQAQRKSALRWRVRFVEM